MSYTRNHGAPSSRQDSTFPRFHVEAIPDEIATAANGRPCFREQERVQIIQPGNPSSPVELLRQDHIDKWPEQYAAFRAGQEQAVSGTPLEQWPYLRKVNVLELKAKNIHTVEQCATLSDLAVQSLGLGGRAIREAASAYLDDAAAMKIVSENIARAEKAEAHAANQDRKIEELTELVNRLHGQLMGLQNAPAAVATYVPGENDPLARLAQAAPQAPQPTASSLDTLTARRPRQRAEAAA